MEEERIINENLPTWPGWTTVKLIGRGSFGAVYEIERDVFGTIEKAALKVIRIPQNESEIEEMYDSGYDDVSITATFKHHLQNIANEYTLMRQMNGAANIVNCDDFRYIQHDNGIGWDIFIRMELLTPLTKALDRVPSEEQVRRVATDMCAALALCRRHGIIHRDIKPQNIFVSPNGDYKLGDFGIAKTIERTSGGTKIGTYKYMAPEVYAVKPYNLTADIYSLGLVLHWLLNERRSPFLPLPPAPVEASAEENARTRRFSGEPVPPPAHGSEDLKRIVLKACAYDPAARYQSAEEMLADLRRLDSIQTENDATFISPAETPILAETPIHAEQPTPSQTVSIRNTDDLPRRPAVSEAQTAGPGSPHPAEPSRTETQQSAGFTPPPRSVRPQSGSYPPQSGSYPPQSTYTQGVTRPADQAARSGKKGKTGLIVLFSMLGALLVLGAILAAAFILPGKISKGGGTDPGSGSGLLSGIGSVLKSDDDDEWLMIKSTYSDENGPVSLTTYDYDANGYPARDSSYYHGSFTGYTINVCDADGNVVEEITDWEVRRYENNADGLHVKEKSYSKSNNGSETLRGVYTWSYDSEGRTNGYEYYLLDENGRETYHYTGHYDGFKLIGYTVNDNGEISEIRVSQTYDKNGNLTHTESFREGESSAYYVSDLSYDRFGNRTGSAYTRTDEDGSRHSGEYVYEYMRRSSIVSDGGYTAERYVHTDELSAVRSGIRSNLWELKDYLLAGWNDEGSSADVSLEGDGGVSLRMYVQGSEQRIEVTNHTQNAVYTFILADDILQREEIKADGSSVKVTPVYNASGEYTDVRVEYSNGTVSMISNETYQGIRLRQDGVDYHEYVGTSEGSPGVYSSVSFDIEMPDGGEIWIRFESGRISTFNVYDEHFDTVIHTYFKESAVDGYIETQLEADVSDEFSVPGVSQVVETRLFSSAGDMIKRSEITYYDANGKDTHRFGYYADGSFRYHYEFRYDSDGRYKDMVSYDEDGKIIDTY